MTQGEVDLDPQPPHLTAYAVIPPRLDRSTGGAFMTLTESVVAGSRLESLRVLRDRLASDLDVCDSARDVSSLSQRFMDVLVQIETLEKVAPEKKGTALDELANRRKSPGRPDPTVQPRAKRTAK